MKSPRVTIGYDVEMSLQDEYGMVRIPTFLKGTKQRPEELECGGAWQRDNCMVEVNGIPTRTATKFRNHARDLYREVTDLVSEVSQDERVLFGINLYHAEVNLSDAQCVEPEAQEIGCEPDFDAWSESQNPRLNHQLLGNHRFASGHIHISCTGSREWDDDERFQFARTVDLLLGPWATMHAQGRGRIRKKFYGKFGSMRLKPYGIEWRVPCLAWFLRTIQSSEPSNNLFVLAKACVAARDYGDIMAKKHPGTVETIKTCVNMVDSAKAKKIHQHMLREAEGILCQP